MRTVQIFDTTLRDGEQSPGVNLSTSEKVEIALQLEELGVNSIEAGFAASSPGDFQSVQAVAKNVKGATVVSLSRSVEKDIEAAWEALKEAESPCIHIFLATSPIHRKSKLRMSKEEILDNLDQAVRYAKRFVPKVEFSAEDAGRTEIDYLCQVAERAIAAGADVLNFPDTVGYLTPEEYADIFIQLRQRVPGIEKVILSAHCHNDLGMAVANALAAIQAGVEQVEGTINGIGERAGNAAIEEVAMALKTRASYYQAATTLNHREIARTSRLVSKLTGMFVPGNKAIVGANAFAHESGIHQDGILKHQSTYEIIRPETVGFEKSRLVLGKHSGRHAFRDHLSALGYRLTDEQINQLFVRFKEMADRKKEITDQDLIALVEEKWGEPKTEVYALEGVQLSSGNQSVPTASVRLRNARTGEILEEAACGNGSLDAIFKAIDRITGEEVELVDCKIVSVTRGKDALGEVYVQLNQKELTVQGRGVSTDILEASARAYIDGINRLIQRRGEKPSEEKETMGVSMG